LNPVIKALAMSHAMDPKPEDGSVKSSTYGILFFGVPVHTERAFSGLAAVALDKEVDSSDPPLIQALKRDLRWLQESNYGYSQIGDDFVTNYFIESAGRATFEDI
jgi:hypothetical protein